MTLFISCDSNQRAVPYQYRDFPPPAVVRNDTFRYDGLRFDRSSGREEFKNIFVTPSATLRRYPFAEVEADYAGFYDFVVSGGVDFWRAGWWVASLFAGIVAARFVRANVLIAQGTA